MYVYRYFKYHISAIYLFIAYTCLRKVFVICELDILTANAYNILEN